MATKTSLRFQYFADGGYLVIRLGDSNVSIRIECSGVEARDIAFSWIAAIKEGRATAIELFELALAEYYDQNPAEVA